MKQNLHSKTEKLFYLQYQISPIKSNRAQQWGSVAEKSHSYSELIMLSVIMPQSSEWIKPQDKRLWNVCICSWRRHKYEWKDQFFLSMSWRFPTLSTVLKGKTAMSIIGGACC